MYQAWLMMRALVATAVTLAMFFAPPAMAADPRAQDAVDLFIDACVTDVLGLRPRVTDPSRITSRQTTDFALQGGGLRTSPVYEFVFKSTRAKVFTSRSRSVCTAWVGHAEEADMLAAFERAVQRAAAEAQATLEPQAADGRRCARVWVLRSPKAKLVLSLAASLPAFGVQHVMVSAPAPEGARP